MKYWKVINNEIKCSPGAVGTWRSKSSYTTIDYSVLCVLPSLCNATGTKTFFASRGYTWINSF